MQEGIIVFFKYAEYLSKRGHKVIIFAKNRNKFYDNYKLPKNLEIFYRGSLKKYFKGIGALNRTYEIIYNTFIVNPYIIKYNDFDYIIGYLRESAIKSVRIGYKHNIKTVNFVFENPSWMEKDLKERWYKEFHGKFKKSWLKTREAYIKSDILLGISKKSKDECEIWINKQVKDYIYPGIEFEKSNQINNKVNQIIYLGRLNEYKNIHEIFYALKKITNPPLLVIVGEGEDSNKIKKLANKLKVKAKFLGNLNEFEKYREIKKSLFMVFPSSHEGFGMPPMDALYCSVPCICSDKPVFKEIYENKVEYFGEHNIDELKNKIEFLLKNPEYCKKRGIEGKVYVKKNFSWEKSAKKIEKI